MDWADLQIKKSDLWLVDQKGRYLENGNLEAMKRKHLIQTKYLIIDRIEI